jgi:hypothetical protein
MRSGSVVLNNPSHKAAKEGLHTDKEKPRQYVFSITAQGRTYRFVGTPTEPRILIAVVSYFNMDVYICFVWLQRAMRKQPRFG